MRTNRPRHTRATGAGLIPAGSGLVLASAIHLYWLAGGRRGRSAVIPTRHGKPLMTPGPGATLAVAGLLAAAGGLYVGVAREWQPAWLYRVGTAGAGAVLVVRAIGDGRTLGITKAVTDTPFAHLDNTVLSPVCAALGSAGLLGALRR